jgi:acyl-CoA thioester hydrolase
MGAFAPVLKSNVTISDIKTDRFVMNHSVFSHAQSAITTTGTSKVVMFDFKTGAKAPITEPLLSALLKYAQDES